SGRHRPARRLERVRDLACGGGRAADRLYYALAPLLSRVRVPTRRRLAVRPRNIGRAGKGARGGRRAAPRSDARGVTLAQCRDGRGHGRGRSNSANASAAKLRELARGATARAFFSDMRGTNNTKPLKDII